MNLPFLTTSLRLRRERRHGVAAGGYRAAEIAAGSKLRVDGSGSGRQDHFWKAIARGRATLFGDLAQPAGAQHIPVAGSSPLVDWGREE